MQVQDSVLPGQGQRPCVPLPICRRTKPAPSQPLLRARKGILRRRSHDKRHTFRASSPHRARTVPSCKALRRETRLQHAETEESGMERQNSSGYQRREEFVNAVVRFSARRCGVHDEPYCPIEQSSVEGLQEAASCGLQQSAEDLCGNRRIFHGVGSRKKFSLSIPVSLRFLVLRP